MYSIPLFWLQVLARALNTNSIRSLFYFPFLPNLPHEQLSNYYNCIKIYIDTQKDTIAYGIFIAVFYLLAFLCSKFDLVFSGFFYSIGLFYLVISIATVIYIIVSRPYAVSPMVKGVPLLATFSVPALLLMLVSATPTSILPFSAYLYSWRS